MRKKSPLRKLITAAAFALTLAFTLAFVPDAQGMAAGMDLGRMPAGDITYRKVDLIDNVLYPTTQDYMHTDSERTWSKFELKVPAVVKAYYTWENTGTPVSVRGSAWFSNDEDGVEIVGAQAQLQKPGTSMTAYLDPGTYYLNQIFTIREKNQPASAVISIGALMQECGTNVKMEVTSFDTPNMIETNTNYKGFLSANSNHDYYQFSIDAAGKFDITFNFETIGGAQTSRGTAILYDSDRRRLVSKNFSVTTATSNVLSYYCDPGMYYVELSGVTAPTLLNVGYTDYTIRTSPSTKSLTNKNVRVDVITPMQATEALVVLGEYGPSKAKDSSVWSTGKGAKSFIDTMACDIGENGTYTVRLRDVSNRYYLATFTIDNIDKDAPEVKGVENGVTYSNKDVAITFSDKNLKSATLDKKKVSGKITLGIKDKGRHTLIVTDKAGNKTKIKFRLKYTEAYYYRTYSQKGETRVSVDCTDKKNIDKEISVSGFKITINTKAADYDKLVKELNGNKSRDRKAVKEIVRAYKFEDIVKRDGTIDQEVLADINRAVSKYYKSTYTKDKKKQVTGVTVTLGVVNE